VVEGHVSARVKGSTALCEIDCDVVFGDLHRETLVELSLIEVELNT
jgi:hypothetical protein